MSATLLGHSQPGPIPRQRSPNGGVSLRRAGVRAAAVVVQPEWDAKMEIALAIPNLAVILASLPCPVRYPVDTAAYLFSDICGHVCNSAS